MQAVGRQFSYIIQGSKQFIIPVFQRDYSWGSEQCRQMWDDIMRASSENGSGHFMGSFVYINESEGAAFNTWLVIDGQQRLTTLTLLLIALRDHIRETHWEGKDPENDPTPEKIDAYFLKNEHEAGSRSYRLALRRRDDATLRSLVDHKDPSEVENNSVLLVEAYKHFRGLLNSSGIDPAQIYRGIARLNIVDVTLERRIDNPQHVFESLNSTGVDLTLSDLVRNYLLMGLREADQTRLYNEYWSRLEDYFRNAGTVPDSFIRDYIALKQKSTTRTREDRIYGEFKQFWPSLDAESTGERLADMLKFARYYLSFLKPSLAPHTSLVDPMSNVSSGGVGNAHGMLTMRLYDCYESGLLSESDFVHALGLIKSYLLRRAVMGLQTNDYWSVFARIAHSIDSNDVFESFRVALARQIPNYRFPYDSEFTKALQERNLYSLRICPHILERLENSGWKEQSPTGNCSIEHIMPQSIEDIIEWQDMLKDDWRKVHETWLHRLGNLTLTAYNSEYSNKPFHEKKTIEGGFNDSPFRLNQFVKEQTQWTEEEMEERGNNLAKRALDIWPFHNANEKLIREADVRALKEQEALKNSDSLEMSETVRALFTLTHNAIRDLGPSIQVIENRSACYYDSSASFFAELLPMSYYVRLLIPLDFSEVDDPQGMAGNTTDWKFLPNVTHRDCGVFIDIAGEQQIAAAIPMIRQALNLVAAG